MEKLAESSSPTTINPTTPENSMIKAAASGAITELTDKEAAKRERMECVRNYLEPVLLQFLPHISEENKEKFKDGMRWRIQNEGEYSSYAFLKSDEAEKDLRAREILRSILADGNTAHIDNLYDITAFGVATIAKNKDIPYEKNVTFPKALSDKIETEILRHTAPYTNPRVMAIILHEKMGHWMQEKDIQAKMAAGLDREAPKHTGILQARTMLNTNQQAFDIEAWGSWYRMMPKLKWIMAHEKCGVDAANQAIDITTSTLRDKIAALEIELGKARKPALEKPETTKEENEKPLVDFMKTIGSIKDDATREILELLAKNQSGLTAEEISGRMELIKYSEEDIQNMMEQCHKNHPEILGDDGIAALIFEEKTFKLSLRENVARIPQDNKKTFEEIQKLRKEIQDLENLLTETLKENDEAEDELQKSKSIIETQEKNIQELERAIKTLKTELEIAKKKNAATEKSKTSKEGGLLSNNEARSEFRQSIGQLGQNEGTCAAILIELIACPDGLTSEEINKRISANGKNVHSNSDILSQLKGVAKRHPKMLGDEGLAKIVVSQKAEGMKLVSVFKLTFQSKLRD